MPATGSIRATRGRKYLASLGDVSAGWALKDDWPRPAYLLMHFTRDPRGHLAALKRVARFPQRLRADRVAHTLRALRRLQNRIDDDHRALAKAGFTLEGTSVDDESNRVEVELVTARDDAAAYLPQALRAGQDRGHRARDDRARVQQRGLLHDRAGRHEPDDRLGHRRRGERPSASRSPSSPTAWRSGSSSACPVGARTQELRGEQGVAASCRSRSARAS